MIRFLPVVLSAFVRFVPVCFLPKRFATDTGNFCVHTAYKEFNPTSWPSACAPTKEDWITTNMGICGEGANYPEEFWNCFDISITATGEIIGIDYLPSRRRLIMWLK